MLEKLLSSWERSLSVSGLHLTTEIEGVKKKARGTVEAIDLFSQEKMGELSMRGGRELFGDQ